MTAVTVSPLPPRSRELKTNKPAAIDREGEIVCVSGFVSLLQRYSVRRDDHFFMFRVSANGPSVGLSNIYSGGNKYLAPC